MKFDIFNYGKGEPLPETDIDVTGVELAPGRPKECKGNGSTLDEEGNLIECCCDECDWYIACFEKELKGEKEWEE